MTSFHLLFIKAIILICNKRAKQNKGTFVENYKKKISVDVSFCNICSQHLVYFARDEKGERQEKAKKIE
ncbi:hypothetical protein BEH_09665 [Priestia filamentosa]|uniref:Uncharacterized protein n=1 Tax=Priestia filamentosa TaxID=1402861 RepID=A0A0H4KVL8_9BACI|nr:hypothetical protein BEH_09665 [Priestia filamentosa]OXS68941.1 hypothetical protein B1B01_08080 [Priestia filamentosa]RJS64355.1 hypothetical protein CJ485_06235 [Priestia filamentosa]